MNSSNISSKQSFEHNHYVLTACNRINVEQDTEWGYIYSAGILEKNKGWSLKKGNQPLHQDAMFIIHRQCKEKLIFTISLQGRSWQFDVEIMC